MGISLVEFTAVYHGTQRHGRLTREQPALLPSPFPGSWASSQAHLGSLGETGRRGEVGGQDERPGLGLASQIAPPAPDEKSRRGDGAPPVPSRRAPGNRPAFAVCSATDDASSQRSIFAVVSGRRWLRSTQEGCEHESESARYQVLQSVAVAVALVYVRLGVDRGEPNSSRKVQERSGVATGVAKGVAREQGQGQLGRDADAGRVYASGPAPAVADEPHHRYPSSGLVTRYLIGPPTCHCMTTFYVAVAWSAQLVQIEARLSAKHYTQQSITRHTHHRTPEISFRINTARHYSGHTTSTMSNTALKAALEAGAKQTSGAASAGTRLIADSGRKAAEWAVANPGKTAAVGAGAVLLAVPMVAAAPLLGAVGFGANGVAAGR
ncbi:hypothetical protein NUW58_g5999 [Xylaria curta]|uniref:Uncharacterized protein n=1 Tax=Xylaria curta TaxID=42375 RepID=A0ACC1P0E2_9PEZI|nr:hypothetical protein NUW58_g5999 [Xylaria curta]